MDYNKEPEANSVDRAMSEWMDSLEEDYTSIDKQFLLNVLEEFLWSNNQDVIVNLALDLARKLDSDSLSECLIDARVIDENDLN